MSQNIRVEDLIDIPLKSMKSMSNEEKLRGVAQMITDLTQLTRDGCVASAWALELVQWVSERNSNSNEIEEEELSAEMMDYNDIMDQIDEEIEEGCSPWVEPSPLLFSYRLILTFLRDTENEMSFRYSRHKELNEFAQHLCSGVIILGWKVMLNDGERILLVRVEGNEESQ